MIRTSGAQTRFPVDQAPTVGRRSLGRRFHRPSTPFDDATCTLGPFVVLVPKAYHNPSEGFWMMLGSGKSWLGNAERMFLLRGPLAWSMGVPVMI